MPEFSLNSDIFCKNSLENLCLNKFRFDIRPLYLNFYSLENFQFSKQSQTVSFVSSRMMKTFDCLFLPPLDGQRVLNVMRIYPGRMFVVVKNFMRRKIFEKMLESQSRACNQAARR